jgi:competence protein ComEC
MWLILWSQRWRLLGFIPIAVGIALSPTLPRPDLLIGRDGLTLAVRGADKKLSALAVRGSTFDLTRWLELDGDSRAAADVANAQGFTCDAIGCAVRVGGQRVAVAMSAAALREDCAAADILIARVRLPRGCPDAKPGQLLLDPSHLARGGAHALYVTPTGVRVETVAGVRGQRPWTGNLQPVTADGTSAGRAPGFTALFERFRSKTEE